MQDLKIHLIINPECELIASDNTVYRNLKYDDDEYLDDLTKHVSVEFLVDSDGDVVRNSIKIKQNNRSRQEFIDGNISVFKFTKDGTFVYFKYLIPKLNHMLKTNDLGEFYKTKDQLFYHDGHIYKSEDDYKTLEEVLLNSIKINDFTELWDVQGTQTFSFQKTIFSVCKLQKCLVYLQRQFLENYNTCVKSGTDRNTRDFLLSAMYVFDYLKDHDNYEEAQKLLDNLSNCAGNLCGENFNKSDCNCGKTIR